MPGYLLGGDTYQAFDSNGDPLSGGLVYTYEAGTSTPLTTYQAYDGTTLSSANANPVVLDSAGRATIWYGQSMSITVKNSSGTTQYTEDIYVDSFVDTPGTVSGFTYGTAIYIDTLEMSDGSSFDIATNIGAAYETVGPTGAGATNTWSALDSLPSTATAVIVTIYGDITPASGTVRHEVWARSGDAAGAGSVGAGQRVFLNGATGQVYGQASTIIIPCSASQIFKLAYDTTGSVSSDNCSMFLQGWVV